MIFSDDWNISALISRCFVLKVKLWSYIFLPNILPLIVISYSYILFEDEEPIYIYSLYKKNKYYKKNILKQKKYISSFLLYILI
jgi:hypothetical protein